MFFKSFKSCAHTQELSATLKTHKQRQEHLTGIGAELTTTRVGVLEYTLKTFHGILLYYHGNEQNCVDLEIVFWIITQLSMHIFFIIPTLSLSPLRNTLGNCRSISVCARVCVYVCVYFYETSIETNTVNTHGGGGREGGGECGMCQYANKTHFSKIFVFCVTDNVSLRR